MSYLNKIVGTVPALWVGAFLLYGCGSADKDLPVPDDALAVVGSSVLTRADMARDMPAGLTADDSTRFVKAYVSEWVDRHLISDIAVADIDNDDIERLTDEYRRHLIMLEYRRRMYSRQAAEIPDDSIKAYYDAHHNEFVLERPMVRGTYLKVPADIANLKVLKRLYRSDKADDADRLEKEVLIGAIHYDYFRDNWVDWEQIESRIPYEFGNKGTWPAAKKHLETTVGGFTYLLYITEVLPVGAPVPYEAARERILTRMLAADRKAYDAKLLYDLRADAEASGKVKINIK